MDPLIALRRRRPLLLFHGATALDAPLLGGVILPRRKGTGSHRALGGTRVAPSAATTVASAFVPDPRLPNLAGFTPIHGPTRRVVAPLALAAKHARRGPVAAHRKTRRGRSLGGAIVAGAFTLRPGRFLGSLPWDRPLTGIAA